MSAFGFKIGLLRLRKAAGEGLNLFFQELDRSSLHENGGAAHWIFFFIGLFQKQFSRIKLFLLFV